MKTSMRSLVLFAIASVLVFTFIPYIKVIVEKSPKEDENIKLLFGGDFMFDRYIRQVSQKHGNDYVIEEIKPMLIDHNLAIVNLESSITNYKSMSIGTVVGDPGHYTFTADPSVAKTLSDNNIKLVNLANNHIMNFGKKGLDQTINNLQTNNVEYFGISEKPYTVMQFQNYKVGFIGYTDFINNSQEQAFSSLAEIKDSVDFVVVYTHWGTEYRLEAAEGIQDLAHKFIDRGTDLVIGSHPHVIQQKEVYKGKTIYYSLGNFVMDQYFTDYVNKGLMISVEIDTKTNDIKIEEIPITMLQDGKTIFGNPK